MWCIAFPCLCLALVGCAGIESSGAPLAADLPPPGVTADGTVMRRLLEQPVLELPLVPQAGDIWADVLLPPQPGPAAPPARRADDLARSAVPVASRAVAPRAVSQLMAAPASAAAVPAADVAVQTVPRDVGRPLVQLAAARSKTGAEAEWQRLRQQAPALTDGRVAEVNEAEVNGQHVWRLRAAGFADLAEASAFCSGIRAVRPGCWVVPAIASIK